MAWLGLIVLVTCGGWFILQDDPMALIGIADDQFSQTARAAAVALTIGGALAMSTFSRSGIVFKQAANWAAVVLAVVSIYSYRDDLIAVAGHFTGRNGPTTAAVSEPAQTRNSGPQVVAIRAMENGQFGVDTLVNRTHVNMLADTGATVVTLTDEDARRIGINMGSLEYSIPLRTANGVTHGALVELDEVNVGGIRVRRVAAVVSQPGALHQSLLGMSYLGELKVSISGDQLVLRE